MPSGAPSTIVADGERDLAVKEPTMPAELDWEGFVAAYFPGSRRHDLKAISAYCAYKRSGVVDGQSPTEASVSEAAERISSRATAVEAWEDEGGAAP